MKRSQEVFSFKLCSSSHRYLLLCSTMRFSHLVCLTELAGVETSKFCIAKKVASYCLSLILPFSSPAQIAVSTDWTEEKRTISEVWRTIDGLYLDRTFNGNDWFAIRQASIQSDPAGGVAARQVIRNMVHELGDRYTKYLSLSEYEATLRAATGKLVGIGVELQVGPSGQGAIVARVEENSPALAAGIQAGDHIANVDGTDAASCSPEEVALLFRGEAHSRVRVRLLREGQKMDVVAVRRPITLSSVEDTMRVGLGGGRGDVGYIKVRSFSASTATEIGSALDRLHSEQLKVLVLDLRGNGGGLLEGAVDTAGLFLKPGKVVVHVVGKEGQPLSTKLSSGWSRLPADSADTNTAVASNEAVADYATPLLVWVDGRTASAAEVLAAALQENGRALVVGERTFGKGVVQRLVPLSHQRGAVAVTYARYETPTHRDINKVGIKVDCDFTCDRKEASSCLNTLVDQIGAVPFS